MQDNTKTQKQIKEKKKKRIQTKKLSNFFIKKGQETCLVFTTVFNFLGFNLKSMHACSQACLPFSNFFG
jgi:hypothetical protein